MNSEPGMARLIGSHGDGREHRTAGGLGIPPPDAAQFIDPVRNLHPEEPLHRVHVLPPERQDLSPPHPRVETEQERVQVHGVVG